MDTEGKANSTNNISVKETNSSEEFFIFPMSFQQEALWFLDQLEPGLPVYNVTICQKVLGNLDINVLKRALNVLVDRHETLRTGFRAVDEQVSQIIQKQTLVDIEYIEKEAALESVLEIVQENAKRGFDLTSKSLMRALVIKYGENQFLILFVIHHIVFDGWSAGIFKKELTDIYNALLKGQEVDLPEPEVQYADYAVWQRKWFQGDTKQEQLRFWRETLGDNPEPLELPTDKVRPARQSFKGEMEFIDFSKELTLSLKGLSIKESCTLFMTIMSAFKVLLYRYSGQEDISVGSPMANRQGQELEGSIGYYVNTVVYRTDLSGNPTFRELVKRMRTNALDVFDNQEMPFDKLVEEIKPDRGLSRNPLFQVMMALQSVPGFDSEFDRTTSEPVRAGTGTSKFDLSIELKEGPDGIKGFLEYNTDLFTSDTCKRMVTNFGVLLQSIVNDPDQRIGSLELIATEEKTHLLQEINNTLSDYPREKLLQQIFEDQVANLPDKVALQFQDQNLTYSQLDAKANQLANFLISNGAGPEKIIGIYLDRGIDMVVGLIGILKSGAAYLPMDPMFPHDRLRYMLDDASASILLTQDRLKSSFPEYQGQVICIDSGWENIKDQSSEKPTVSANAENLAYIIYTSGSTGKPKGVQIEHQNVVNFLLSMQKAPGITSNDTLMSVTTLSFDISILEIFLPLITGAKLIVVSKEQSMEGGALLQEIESSKVTVMQATPSTWRLMLDSGWENKIELKVLCGGEALPQDLANQIIAKCGSLWNVYGPTETTIWSTCKEITSEDNSITIGKPIDNTQVYILDNNLQLAPKGVIGELCIGGDGIARGYLNRPELTSDRFIKNPINHQSEDRIYRTGDLAKILVSGEIECLGRLDNQVKIRGYRIELGEIESSLSQHPKVNECVLAVKGEGVLDSRLVAYLIAEGDAPAVEELKSLVRNNLPDYMVPAHMIFLTEFPKTSNGKIDRKSLPDPDFKELQSEAEYTVAEDELEQGLVNIWEKLLGISPIGVKDNFFELGGHSLLAARITFQIKKKLGIELPLEMLFQAQTVRELAVEIKNQGWKPKEQGAKKSGFLKIFRWK